MNKYAELVAKIIATGDVEEMKELNTILVDHFIELEVSDPKMYWAVVHKLHELANGVHFDLEYAQWAVSQMLNEDGTTGEHWTVEQTTLVAKTYAIVFDTFNEFDWYYTLNMLYSDHMDSFKDDVEAYTIFAEDWLCDKDAPKGKAYLYYTMLTSYK